MPRGAKETYKCKGCGQPFEARVADHKRGWSKYCSKSCKATVQVQWGGQYTKYQGPAVTDDDDDECDYF